MAKILCKTKDAANPKGKPRVYFTCHPDDFAPYFQKITDDIFATHDVAIYYTEDMTVSFDEAHLETDLGQMNLFVVPVTWKLLSQPNRAMDGDIAYARENEIPILPFMMEPGLDDPYGQPNKFGKLQYLDPNSTDPTQISYKEKLKRHLESVLISDEMAKRIRAAFDAYIFLSYRKKDRKYANELMKRIHKNRELWDVAIWYDEFLTPGESFEENIKKALEDSKLFTLLVTPNLLEEPGGKPNFVMGEEYPAAVKAEKTIVPAQMVQTDRKALEEKFPSIPVCSDPEDEAAFQERLLRSIKKVAVSANDADPEHNFLIGLAYLEGMDVEVNRQRGIELITMAAEASLPEAMQALCAWYYGGSGTNPDYPKAIHWAQSLVTYMKKQAGETHADTLKAMEQLASAHYQYGNYQEAEKLFNLVSFHRNRQLGNCHPDVLSAMRHRAACFVEMKNRDKAIWQSKFIYEQCQEVLGKEHPETVRSLLLLARCCSTFQFDWRAWWYNRKGYKLCRRIYGAEDELTQAFQYNLAMCYIYVGNYWKALTLAKKIYEYRRKTLGEDAFDTVNALTPMAIVYFKRKQYKKALELEEKIYAARSKLLGKGHAALHVSLNHLGALHYRLKNYEKAVEYAEQAYILACGIYGPEHENTLKEKKNLDYMKKKL